MGVAHILRHVARVSRGNLQVVFIAVRTFRHTVRVFNILITDCERAVQCFGDDVNNRVFKFNNNFRCLCLHLASTCCQSEFCVRFASESEKVWSKISYQNASWMDVQKLLCCVKKTKFHC
mmetsp:Transcript_2100/g.6413  ORF Transcript_2100/g.6413 Transcript_2100/m.6413 type:complete len:120 (+) Transcript_2100:2819-3178(+)